MKTSSISAWATGPADARATSSTKLVEAAQRERHPSLFGVAWYSRLRRAICNWYKDQFDVVLDPETRPSSPSGRRRSGHLALACMGPGDSVLVPNPAYPIHPYGFIIAGADVRHVPMTPEHDFFEELHKAIDESWPRPKMLVVNFPGNPTAECVDLEFFERVIEIAREQYLGDP